jgi:hypothetical protein
MAGALPMNSRCERKRARSGRRALHGVNRSGGAGGIAGSTSRVSNARWNAVLSSSAFCCRRRTSLSRSISFSAASRRSVSGRISSSSPPPLAIASSPSSTVVVGPIGLHRVTDPPSAHGVSRRLLVEPAGLWREPRLAAVRSGEAPGGRIWRREGDTPCSANEFRLPCFGSGCAASARAWRGGAWRPPWPSRSTGLARPRDFPEGHKTLASSIEHEPPHRRAPSLESAEPARLPDKPRPTGGCSRPRRQ